MAASRADGMQSLNRRYLSDTAGSGLFDAYLRDAGVTDEWENHTDLEPFNAA